MSEQHRDCDYVVVGSGFGGSVDALRLAEKGYRVLVVEKGRWYRSADFPKTNWDLRRWLWMPALRFFGFFRISILRHVTVLSGVGVGGGSLVYANVLSEPSPGFYDAPSWAHLADWRSELRPWYEQARRMLGVAPNPRLQVGDTTLLQIAEEDGRPGAFSETPVGVYLGEPGVPPQAAGRWAAQPAGVWYSRVVSWVPCRSSFDSRSPPCHACPTGSGTIFVRIRKACWA